MSCSKFKRGKVYIFNVNKMKPPSEDERLGSGKDVQNLKSLFEYMDAEVDEPLIDVTENEIKAKMQEIKVKDFSGYDYVVIVYSSHGGEDSMALTAARENISIQRSFLVPLFKNETLSKKLKWLITQTCRGEKDLYTEGPKEGMPFIDPKFYLISYSTSEGFYSRRCTVTGSIFIQCLCEELREHSGHEDILTILKRVSDSVRLISSQLGIDQKPSNEENFGNEFRFTFFNESVQEGV